eukprot:EG_transcript_36684
MQLLPDMLPIAPNCILTTFDCFGPLRLLWLAKAISPDPSFHLANPVSASTTQIQYMHLVQYLHPLHLEQHLHLVQYLHLAQSLHLVQHLHPLRLVQHLQPRNNLELPKNTNNCEK